MVGQTSRRSMNLGAVVSLVVNFPMLASLSRSLIFAEQVYNDLRFKTFKWKVKESIVGYQPSVQKEQCQRYKIEGCVVFEHTKLTELASRMDMNGEDKIFTVHSPVYLEARTGGTSIGTNTVNEHVG